jgi:hypothetical protein
MLTRPVVAPAARLLPSPFWRGIHLHRLPGFLFFLSSLNLSAQTTISGTQIHNPLPPVAALPGACKPYSAVYLTTNNTAYICTAPNTYTPLAAGTGGSSSGSGLPSPSGTPGYLFTNGSTVSWGNLQTGSSGALDCISTPGQCDVTSIVPLKNASNVWTGSNDFHSGLLRIPESTVAALPAASNNNGREFMVVDGASTCDTSTGGGSLRVLVQSNGSTYVAPNCSTGGGNNGTSGATSTSQLTDFLPSYSAYLLTVQPGRIRFGVMACTNFTTPATAIVSSMSGGSGVGKLYISSSCTLVLQYPSMLTVTWNLSGMTAQPVATPVVPADAWYVGDVNIGPSSITAVTDKRSIAGKDPTLAGTGIVIDCTLGACLASIDTAVVPTLGGVNAYTGAQDATAATVTKPSRTVAADPTGLCVNDNEVILSTASGNLFSCFAGTWHATGGGGGGTTTNITDSAASQYVTTGNTQIITNNNDVIIVASNNLPALAAGACWDYEVFLTSGQSAYPSAVKVWYGSGQAVGSVYSAGSSLASDGLFTGSGNNPAVVWLRGQICNNNGSQAAQTATLFSQFAQSYVHGTYGTTGPMSQTTTATNLQIGISWAGAEGITIQSFRVWLTQ